MHFLVLRNFSKFLLLGKRNPNTQRVYRNHTFCLLLACWLVGFSFSLLSGLQPPSKLVAVAMIAIGASRNQNLESLVTFPKFGVVIARGWSQPLLLFFFFPLTDLLSLNPGCGFSCWGSGQSELTKAIPSLWLEEWKMEP